MGIQQGQCEEESIVVDTHRKISNDLTSHLKKVGKEVRIRPKTNRGKIKTEEKWTKWRLQNPENSKVKNSIFGKEDKTENPLARVRKKRKKMFKYIK